jgi:Uma2 family endonuclease
VGLLQEDERVELVGGKIIDMAPIGSRHASCVKRLIHLFAEKLKKRGIVSAQDPIQIEEFSELQPDVALLKYRGDFYAGKHPTSEDVLLLIEVSDSSLEYDREIKIPLYAGASVHEVWLVNLMENCVEVYCCPSGTGYEVATKFFHKQIVSPTCFPDISLAVDQVVGESSL